MPSPRRFINPIRGPSTNGTPNEASSSSDPLPPLERQAANCSRSSTTSASRSSGSKMAPSDERRAATEMAASFDCQTQKAIIKESMKINRKRETKNDDDDILLLISHSKMSKPQKRSGRQAFSPQGKLSPVFFSFGRVHYINFEFPFSSSNPKRRKSWTQKRKKKKKTTREMNCGTATKGWHGKTGKGCSSPGVCRHRWKGKMCLRQKRDPNYPIGRIERGGRIICTGNN